MMSSNSGVFINTMSILGFCLVLYAGQLMCASGNFV